MPKVVDEKIDGDSVGQADEAQRPSQADATIELVHAYTDEQKREVRNYVDKRLMPLLCISYGLQFIDKAALGYGALFNLREDTHLKGTQYASLTTMFYAGYLVFQFPANFLIQKFHAGHVLGIAFFAWGAGCMLFAVCKDFAGLATLRWLVGMAECLVSPSFVMITTTYYTRREIFFRVLIFCSMNTVFASWAGVITYFLGKYSVDHPGTMSGWKSVNLLLGGLTVVWSFFVYFFISTAENVRWLSPEQRLIIKSRLVEGKSNSNEVRKFDWKQAKECLRDPQVYAFCIFQFLLSFSNGGITTFGSLVLKGLGFSSIETTYYQIPIYITGTIWILTAGYLNYKYKGLLVITMVLSIFMSFMGFLLMGLLPTRLSWVKYGVYYTQTLWSTASFLQWSLLGVNIAGRTKRSIVSSVVFISYAAGNMVGPQAYKASDAPKYLHGLTADAACFGVAMLDIFLLGCYYVYINRKRDRLAKASGRSAEDLEREGEELGETDTTDLKNPHFRYVY